MKTVCIVKVNSVNGVEWFYAGVESKVDALLMAAMNGYTGDAVEVQAVNNREAVQPGEWRPIPVG